MHGRAHLGTLIGNDLRIEVRCTKCGNINHSLRYHSRRGTQMKKEHTKAVFC
jgi:hypothetical protein